MASPNPPTKASYYTLLSAGFWMKYRARLLGALLLGGIILVAALFFTHRSSSREADAWKEVYEFLGSRGSASEIQFEGTIKGSSAEPGALFLSAQRAFAEEDLDRAEEFVLRLREEFPDHFLNAPSQGEEPRTAALLADIRAEKAWRSTNEMPEANPQPPEEHWVTLSTSLGEVRIGLYMKDAPVACREFLKLVREIRASGGAVDEVAAGTFVVLSALAPTPAPPVEGAEEPVAPTEGDSSAAAEQPEQETAEPSKIAQGIVPDRNLLSHYSGAISFRRSGSDLAVKSTGPRVAIYLTDSPWSDNSEVVFAQVLDGLEQMRQLSEREQDEDTGRLKEPLQITSVTESEALKDIP